MVGKGDFRTLIESFLLERQQIVVLNVQESEWLAIKTGVPQGSVLGPFVFIYINHLSDNLKSNVKLFPDNTSIFSVVRDPIYTSQKLSNYLDRVSPWANKWKFIVL